MDLTPHLDVDVVAIESEDEVALMLELVAPADPQTRTRPPATLQIVLDRSGSMTGERMDAAKVALDALVSRLDPTDHFGLVVFDSDVQVAVPAGPLTDKQAVSDAIARVHAGSMTNLSGGLLRGIQEARRAAGGEHATLLLLSDGHANEGMVDHAALAQVATGAQREGIATGTLGLGLDYDEALMSAIARGGCGSTLFAQDGDAAGALLAGEVEGLLTQAAQAVSLMIRPQGQAPGAMKSELFEEATLLRSMAQRATKDDSRLVSKLNEADWSRKMRKWGRG